MIIHGLDKVFDEISSFGIQVDGDTMFGYMLAKKQYRLDPNIVDKEGNPVPDHKVSYYCKHDGRLDETASRMMYFLLELHKRKKQMFNVS